VCLKTRSLRFSVVRIPRELPFDQSWLSHSSWTTFSLSCNTDSVDDDDDDVEIVPVVLFVLVARKFEEKNKAAFGSTSSSRTAAAPNVAKLSSPLDEACLNIYVSVKREREKERERFGLISSVKREKSQDCHARKKKLFRQTFPLFFSRFFLYRGTLKINLPLS